MRTDVQVRAIRKHNAQLKLSPSRPRGGFRRPLLADHDCPDAILLDQRYMPQLTRSRDDQLVWPGAVRRSFQKTAKSSAERGLQNR